MAVESPGCRAVAYCRHRPEQIALNQVVQQPLETYLALAGEEDPSPRTASGQLGHPQVRPSAGADRRQPHRHQPLVQRGCARRQLGTEASWIPLTRSMKGIRGAGGAPNLVTTDELGMNR